MPHLSKNMHVMNRYTKGWSQMAKSKIRDTSEVKRWYEEGRTYSWMVQEYQRKYHEEVTASMFSNFRARHGLKRRIARDDGLIPWEVKHEHRWGYPLAILRVEARRRGGFELRQQDAERLEAFKQKLSEDGVVVHYEPRTKQGWWLMPRRPGVDLDLIREPEHGQTKRHNRDN